MTKMIIIHIHHPLSFDIRYGKWETKEIHVTHVTRSYSLQVSSQFDSQVSDQLT